VTHPTNGKVSYSHKVLTPVVVAPGHPRVIALEPAFIVPQDGAKKQDCELNAAKRWIERNATLAAKQVIILGDDLFSTEPFCKDLLIHGFHFILVCKPDSHKTLYEEVAAFERTGDLPTFSIHRWNGRFHERATYRYINQLPLNGGETALEVNWVELTLTRTDSCIGVLPMMCAEKSSIRMPLLPTSPSCRAMSPRLSKQEEHDGRWKTRTLTSSKLRATISNTTMVMAANSSRPPY
jgi:hypothetical protein